MAADETTKLLGKPAGDIAQCSEELSENEGTVLTNKKFALWQIGALCGISLAYSDTSLVWATHETIASRFGQLPNSSWMMTSFTIGYCVTLPLYGRMSDKYGRLRPLISAYCIFCIGCTSCGLGQAYWQVIFGRITTGCGASGMVSLASIIITDIATPSNVAVLRSYVSVAATVGISLGGPLGGFLSGTIGWRWLFLGQVPFAAGCCVFIAQGPRMFLPVRDEEYQRPQEEHANEPKPDVLAFDFPGAVTLAISISSLLTVIDLQNQFSWRHPLLLGLTIVGAVSTFVFLALETFPGNRKLLMPLRLLRTQIGAFCAVQFLILGSAHGFVSHIAPYFSNTRGASDAEGGGQTVPSSIGNAMGALLSGRIIKKYGNYKRLSLVSLVLCTATSIPILFLWSNPIETWEEAVTTFPFGLFGGMVLSAQFIGLFSCAPKQQMATAISMHYMSQQIGIAVGISISSHVLKQQYHAALEKMLVDVPGYQGIIRRVLTDSSVVALLPTEISSLVRQSYLNSFWVIPILAISAQVLALFPMISETETHSN